MNTKLPEISDEDRQFLHYNPNTSDVVEWVQEYAHTAVVAERVACCKAIDAIDDGEAPEYRACQEAIMARSNARTVGPDAALCGRSHTSDGLGAEAEK